MTVDMRWPERPDTRYSSDRPTLADETEPPKTGPNGECGLCGGEGTVAGPTDPTTGCYDGYDCPECDGAGVAA